MRKHSPIHYALAGLTALSLATAPLNVLHTPLNTATFAAAAEVREGDIPSPYTGKMVFPDDGYPIVEETIWPSKHAESGDLIEEAIDNQYGAAIDVFPSQNDLKNREIVLKNFINDQYSNVDFYGLPGRKQYTARDKEYSFVPTDSHQHLITPGTLDDAFKSVTLTSDGDLIIRLNEGYEDGPTEGFLPLRFRNGQEEAKIDIYVAKIPQEYRHVKVTRQGDGTWTGTLPASNYIFPSKGQPEQVEISGQVKVAGYTSNINYRVLGSTAAKTPEGTWTIQGNTISFQPNPGLEGRPTFPRIAQMDEPKISDLGNQDQIRNNGTNFGAEEFIPGDLSYFVLNNFTYVWPDDIREPASQDDDPNLLPTVDNNTSADANNVNEVPADGTGTKLENVKVTNPTDGITGTVKNKDGQPIKDATVTVDRNTGVITVTVPAGTPEGDATVELTDANNKPIDGTINIKITKPAPSVTPDNTTPDTVEAGNPKGTELDEKVENPTDGITGTVKNKDGQPIKDATVTVDRNTGVITVTVPAGTPEGDATVELTDANNKPIDGTINIKITKPAPSVTPDNTTPKATSSVDGKCIATLVGWSLPLLALIPVGIALNAGIPVVEEAMRPVNEQLAAWNFQAQQQLGLYNEQLAEMANRYNQEIQMAATGLGVAAVAIGLIASIATTCGGAGSSNGSSR